MQSFDEKKNIKNLPRKRPIRSNLAAKHAIMYEQALMRLMNGNNSLTKISTIRGRHVASSYDEVEEKPVKVEAEEPIGAKEASRILGVIPRTVIRLAERGEIKAFRVGELWKFYASDVRCKTYYT